ncbi:hypothetical protein J6590_088862 [Homalodisca vitripennis]|nr:hypothetical protein J6590_088862 [Homalodisca vitripennis]
MTKHAASGDSEKGFIALFCEHRPDAVRRGAGVRWRAPSDILFSVFDEKVTAHGSAAPTQQHRGISLPTARCPSTPFQYGIEPTQLKPMCHVHLGNPMDVQERHIKNCKFRDSGLTAGDDCWSLGEVSFPNYQSFLLASTWVCPPACFDWGDRTLRLVPLFFLMDLGRRRPLPIDLTNPEYPVRLEAALRCLQD